MRSILANIWDCSNIDRAIIISSIIIGAVAMTAIILWK